MITRDEIVNRSEELSIHTSNVQRDYVFGWILAAIYSHSDLSNYLVLKGGNCFRKAYFQKARYSPDLDFAAIKPVTPEFLTAQLNSVCDFINQRSGVKFETNRTRVDERPTVDSDNTIHKARLYFKDFFGQESEISLAVRLDISQFNIIHLPVQTRNLVHQYSDSNEIATSIKCLKLEELLAAKLKCLLQRRHVADLYDFVNATLINPAIEIDRAELVQAFLKMTIFSKGPGVVKDLLVNLPFQIIRGLWDKYIVCPPDANVGFDRAVEGFISTIDDLFGSLPRMSGEYVFFPAHLRNPIMQAGQDLTLLRLVYDGIPREVEPYSLIFKVRQNGVGREYLYVFDQTGGRSAGPGIKTLVHPKISAIENTDIKFEPRNEVELSKAGEYFADHTFHGSPGNRLSTFTSLNRHFVQCPICGKRFERKNYNTQLHPHKDQYGNKCLGRVGFIV